MVYTLDIEQCKRHFDAMPVAFTIIEIVCDEKRKPVDFIFRYANNALAELEEVPLEALLEKHFYKDIFPHDNTKKWLPYYNGSAFNDEIHELHEYSPEIKKYIKIVSFPWEKEVSHGLCACILVDETELVQKRSYLHFLASYDTVTDTLNKNAWHEYKQNCSASSLGIIFVDVNGLKSCNDSFGHEAGDYLLSLVIDKIHEVIVSKGRLYRIGGDEFLIAIENTSENIVYDILEQLREKMINTDVPHFPQCLASLGCSYGEGDFSIDALQKQADWNMYYRKKEYYSSLDGKAESENSKFMLWKDCYSLGVDYIDNQHKNLFSMVADLYDSITNNADANEYRKYINFMKEYVVTHFKDEEDYQYSIGYEGLEEHRKIHNDFIMTVAEFEKELIENNFDVSSVRKFAGSLTSWLICHVMNDDKKITENGMHKQEWTLAYKCASILFESIVEVLDKSCGFRRDGFRLQLVDTQKIYADYWGYAELKGAVESKIYYGFSKELVTSLVSNVFDNEHSNYKEIVASVLCRQIKDALETAICKLGLNNLPCELSVLPAALDKTVIAVNKAVLYNTQADDLKIFIVPKKYD